MNRFWQGAAVNTTGPTAFEGQASGHWTLGNLYLRSPGARRADRDREPALVPGGVRRHRRLRRRVLVHRFRPAGGVRARDRAERGRLRLRTRPRDHLAGHRRDDVQAPGPRAVGEQPERQLLRDRAGARGGRVVAERPGLGRDLRGDRDLAGDLHGLRRGAARLRRRRPAPLDSGGGLGRDGGAGAGQRQLRVEGGAGVDVPGRRHPARGVRDVGLGHRDRDGAHGRQRHVRPAGPGPGAARPRPPGHRGADGGRRRAPGLHAATPPRGASTRRWAA